MLIRLTKGAQRQLDRALAKIQDGISELSALVIDFHAPALWLDFLNANPQDARSMWPVYREFIKLIKILKEQYSCSRDIRELKLMSKEEFLERYSLELQEDVESLHKGMKKVIDDKRADLIRPLIRRMDEEKTVKPTKQKRQEMSKAEAEIKGGANIPPLSFSMGLEWNEESDDEYPYQASLYTPAANHKNFWLAAIYEGMITGSYRDGEIIVRQCDECSKYFVPAPHSHGQRFHSPSCRSRFHARNRRKSLP